jgi:hypothetical protein
MHGPRSPRSALLSAAAVALALAAFLIAGCSNQDQGGLNMPTRVTATSGASRVLMAGNAQDMGALMRIQNAHTPDLMRIPGVVGTGAGATADGRAAVLVLTRRAGVAGIPHELDGAPVEVRIVGDVVAYVKPDKGPGGGHGGGGGGGALQCGTSTGNDKECASGTIGCVVVRGGNQYFLSNNHVFARENAASTGERIDAPGRYDGKPKCSQTPQIGTLADYVTIRFGGQSNVVDCAIAAPVSGLSFTCAEAGGYTPTSNVVSPSVGLAVKKTGRTSGLTHDTIQAVNVTINVGYTAGVATFTQQIMTSGQFIRSGDSGSLMVTESGNDPVGLCFAGGSGGSFANPIGPVLQSFSATVCGQ